MNNRLKLLRTTKGLQQKDVAMAIGITTSYYGMIEVGSRKPSLIIALKLANFFNIPVENIFLQK
ncbi:helix-turn-helix transcriptional regulator [Romboutsia ilealis]|uniref:helix-turn-helix transcriptional regulator n=1 Tax=Romboutsia ilealis TaxID=1115758 RepID=UPI0023F35E35|nr:helix-turn-helix domain-containing protein [Romboutsia ilealis]